MKIAKIIYLVFLGLLQACGGSGGDDAEKASTLNACNEIDSADKTFTKIIGGDVCTIDLSTPIVRIAAMMSNENDSFFLPICSGTVISKRAVLTAAHCTADFEFSGYEISGYGIIWGPVNNLRFIKAEEVLLAPGYSALPTNNKARVFNDLAVLKFNNNLSINSLAVLTSRAATKNEEGLVFGYGVENSNPSESTNNFRNLRAGVMKVQEVTPNHIFVRYSGAGANVCFGDSGGPILLKTEAGWAIAGVVSQGSSRECAKGDVSTFANIGQTELGSWLQTVVPDSLRF